MRSKIENLLEKSPGFLDVLDDMVHDEASKLGSAVNNDGLKSQLEFLKSRGISEEDVVKELQGDDE